MVGAWLTEFAALSCVAGQTLTQRESLGTDWKLYAMEVTEFDSSEDITHIKTFGTQWLEKANFSITWKWP